MDFELRYQNVSLITSGSLNLKQKNMLRKPKKKLKKFSACYRAFIEMNVFELFLFLLGA